MRMLLRPRSITLRAMFDRWPPLRSVRLVCTAASQAFESTRPRLAGPRVVTFDINVVEFKFVDPKDKEEELQDTIDRMGKNEIAVRSISPSQPQHQQIYPRPDFISAKDLENPARLAALASQSPPNKIHYVNQRVLQSYLERMAGPSLSMQQLSSSMEEDSAEEVNMAPKKPLLETPSSSSSSSYTPFASNNDANAATTATSPSSLSPISSLTSSSSSSMALSPVTNALSQLRKAPTSSLRRALEHNNALRRTIAGMTAVPSSFSTSPSSSSTSSSSSSSSSSFSASFSTPHLSDASRDLLQAASQGDLGAVIHLLDHKGAVLDARSRRGGTALHYAAECGHVHVVAELLQRGIHVDARAANASTAAHWAAGAGAVDALRLLLEKGADPRATTSTWSWTVFGKASGQTPMHWAVESGHEACVELLLQYAPDLVGTVDEKDITPLHVAKESVSGWKLTPKIQQTLDEKFVAVQLISRKMSTTKVL